jgi:hypothetical protein
MILFLLSQMEPQPLSGRTLKLSEEVLLAANPPAPYLYLRAEVCPLLTHFHKIVGFDTAQPNPVYIMSMMPPM